MKPLLAGAAPLGHAHRSMRSAGTLLTVLALLLAQAPWVACACEGDATVLPLLAVGLGHADAAHEHADEQGHVHPCCDHIAHAVHGSDHAHGSHCHGTFTHTHNDESPEAPAERHDGFRLALRTLPSDVHLDEPAATPTLFDAFLEYATWHVLGARALIGEPDPPERATRPPAATERLLL